MSLPLVVGFGMPETWSLIIAHLRPEIQNQLAAVPWPHYAAEMLLSLSIFAERGSEFSPVQPESCFIGVDDYAAVLG
jgi:hypothetical protein